MYVTRQRFSICDTCMRRQNDHEQFKLVQPKDCLICRGLTSIVESISRKILHSLRAYDFSTFSVGMILPPGVQEREDQIRSELKMRGRETIKSQISGEICRSIANATKKKLDKLKPDITVLVNMAEPSLQFSTKPLFIHGRYTKPAGLGQRRTFCERCSGNGCDDCANTGHTQEPSVESIVSSRLGKIMESGKMKFTWLGSEDLESKVCAPGRPIIVELKSPRKRVLPRRLRMDTGKGRIELSGLEILRGKPTKLPNFIFVAKAIIKPAGKILPRDLMKLGRQMKNTKVRFQTSKGKLVHKTVHSIRVRAVKGKIVAEMKIDGGLPIKRLISGDAVSPSMSEFLKISLTCEKFDILKVWEVGSFVY